MKVITYIYQDFIQFRKNGTDKVRFAFDRNTETPADHHVVSSSFKFRHCCEYFDYEVINLAKSNQPPNLGDVLRGIYETVKYLPPDEVCMYADGADTFFLRPIIYPADRVLYMSEKGLWPNTLEMAGFWNDHFLKHPPRSAWKYLNGGAWIGPAGLVAEWYESTGLNNVGKIEIHNSQRAQALAYIQWREKGGPILLDDECRELQTIGFADPTDFTVLESGLIQNNVTGTMPAIFHGNGRTRMDWVYEAANKAHAYTT